MVAWCLRLEWCKSVQHLYLQNRDTAEYKPSEVSFKTKEPGGIPNGSARGIIQHGQGSIGCLSDRTVDLCCCYSQRLPTTFRPSYRFHDLYEIVWNCFRAANESHFSFRFYILNWRINSSQVNADLSSNMRDYWVRASCADGPWSSPPHDRPGARFFVDLEFRSTDAHSSSM